MHGGVGREGRVGLRRLKGLRLHYGKEGTQVYKLICIRDKGVNIEGGNILALRRRWGEGRHGGGRRGGRGEG